MSGRKKLVKQQVIDDMFAKRISVGEAQARMTWVKTGVYQPPTGAGRTAVVKSAGPVTGYERYDDHLDPQVREWARAAAHRDMVTKGLVPWPTPERRQQGTVRAMVQVPGPDGVLRWQPVRSAPAAGPPIVPPGTAGR